MLEILMGFSGKLDPLADGGNYRKELMMQDYFYIALIGAAIWNIFVFLLYGVDKRRAIRHKWRIRESVLLVCAFLMGGVGAWLGMRVFRHKTKHLSFVIGIPVACLITLATLAWAAYRISA